MPLPTAVARFNRRYTNRCIEPIVRRSSGFAVVRHIGRRSGSPYRTPVNVFDLDDDLIVALTYGPSADWVKNVLACSGSIERNEATRAIIRVTLVDCSIAWPALPLLVRAVLRCVRVHDFLRISTDGSSRT